MRGEDLRPFGCAQGDIGGRCPQRGADFRELGWLNGQYPGQTRRSAPTVVWGLRPGAGRHWLVGGGGVVRRAHHERIQVRGGRVRGSRLRGKDMVGGRGRWGLCHSPNRVSGLWPDRQEGFEALRLRSGRHDLWLGVFCHLWSESICHL